MAWGSGEDRREWSEQSDLVENKVGLDIHLLALPVSTAGQLCLL